MASAGVPSAAAISIPFDNPRRVAGRGAESLADRTRHGPVEIVAERPERKRRGLGGCSAAGDFPKPRLETLLRAHQLARQLRVEIALPVDARDDGVTILDGTIGRDPGPLGVRAQCRQPNSPFVELCPRGRQGVESALVRGEAVAVASSQRRDHPRGRPETPRVRNGEHHPEIAALAELVQFREPRAQFRPFRLLLLLEPPDFRVDRRQLRGRLPGLRIALAQFHRPDLPCELELAQIAKQRALFRGQTIRLVMQRLETFGRARRERLGTRAIRELLPRRARRAAGRAEQQWRVSQVFCGRKL